MTLYMTLKRSLFVKFIMNLGNMELFDVYSNNQFVHLPEDVTIKQTHNTPTFF